MRLSEAQRSFLRHLNCHYPRFAHRTAVVRGQTIRALRVRGLVFERNHKPPWRITKAGRRALQEDG